MRQPAALIPRPIAAVILAAGLGTRLGCIPKSALRIGQASILERIVAALREADVARVSVVIGPYRDQLLPLIARCGATALKHRQDHPTLLDSQRLALSAHLANCPDHDLMLVVADLPLLSGDDIRHLTLHWQHRAPGISALIPVVDGTRGHPLLLSSAAVGLANSMPVHQGVRDWLHVHSDAVYQLQCTQQSFVLDVDSAEDLLRLQAILAAAPDELS